MSTSLNNLKPKLVNLDVRISKTVPVDLKKFTDVVKNTKFYTLKAKVMMDLKTIFFINQHLMLQNFKKTKVLIMFLIYVPNRESKQLLNSKLKPLYNAS